MIINGYEDEKYVKIGKQIKELCDCSVQYTVSNCSHNTHLERPEEFIDYITSITNPGDKCKVCGDVIAYCSCYLDVIKEVEGK